MTFKKFVALIFALYPILWIYKSPLPFVYGDLLLFIIAIFGSIKYGFSIKEHLPFLVLWIYIAVTNIYNSLGSLSVTTFVPGGITFFIFAFSYIFLCDGLDIEQYKKYYKLIAVASIVFWGFQEFLFLTTGTRVSGLIPFLDIAGDLTTSDLIAEQLDSERSSSFFRETAHFIQFLLPILCIDLFEKKNRDKWFSPFSLLLVFCMVFSRSGNALVGLSVVLLAKTIYMLKKKKHFVVYLLFLIPILAAIIFYYITSEIGEGMMARADEFDNETASGYLRVIRGYLVFSALPQANQLFGTSMEMLESLLSRMAVINVTGDTTMDLYFNGFQNLIIYDGLVGLVFYLFFYISVYRKTTYCGKVLIWLTLIMSLISNIYLTYCMLICMVVSTIETKYNEHEKNCILHQKRIS